MLSLRHVVTAATLLATLGACGPVGQSPAFEPISDQVAYVGRELSLTLWATDPDAQDLYFDFHNDDLAEIASRAEIRRFGGGASAVFRWTPFGKDVGAHPFDFTASDGEYTATETIVIDVKSSVGVDSAPLFREPQGTGTVLDLAVDKCLDLNVVVEDRDSGGVTLEQEVPEIEGATLMPRGDFTAAWHWCPTAAQVDVRDPYVLRLSASDGDNPKTVFEFLIVLEHETKACEGTSPAITHTPANVATLGPLDFEATVIDPEGLKGSLLFYYATTRPASPLDLSSLTVVTMKKRDGDVWAADGLPNPVAGGSAGDKATIYYVIVAREGDDSTGACQHETRAPPTGVFTATVENPGGGGTTTAACLDDLAEPDDGPTTARYAEMNFSPYVSNGNRICSANDDWYQVQLYAGETLYVSLLFPQSGPTEDLDLHFYQGAVDLTPCFEIDPMTCAAGNGQGADANETMSYTTTSGGAYYVVVHGYDFAANDYDLCIGIEPWQCPAP